MTSNDNVLKNWMDAIMDVRQEKQEGHIIRTISVSHQKLRQTIEKYGVDAKSKSNTSIFEIMWMMHESDIDVVMEYKPNVINNGYVYIPHELEGYRDYILKKILENDVDYKYNRYPFLSEDGDEYVNALEYAREQEIEYPYQIKIEKIVTLLHNHMKRGTTLFEMMRPCLEESDKKRRFQ